MSTLTRRLTVIYSLTLTQTHRLPILTLSDSLPSILTCRLAVYLFSHSHSGSLSVYSHTIRLLPICSHTIWLSILTPADSLPTYSHTIRLTAIYSHSIRLAAYLFSHYQDCCHLFSHDQAHSLSILTLKLLSICFHTQCY